MNVEPPETLVIIESIVYKSNGFAILAHKLEKDRYLILRPDRLKGILKKWFICQGARKSHKRNQEAILRQIKPDLDMLESAAWVEEID
jgi:hypothetical protein